MRRNEEKWAKFNKNEEKLGVKPKMRRDEQK